MGSTQEARPTELSPGKAEVYRYQVLQIHQQNTERKRKEIEMRTSLLPLFSIISPNF